MKLKKLSSLFLVFLLIFSFGLTFITLMVDFGSLNSNFNSGGDQINLKVKTNVPFIINENTDFPTYANGTGNGSASNPWIIQDYYIDSVPGADGILIDGTTEHFIIQNCTILNRDDTFSGIRIQTTVNGMVRNCTLN